MEPTTSAPRAEILRTRDFLGWDVTDAGGHRVGTVSDLLIDRMGKVRFLAVDLGLFRRSVLLPVTALEWGEGVMALPRWTVDEVKALPAYEGDRPLTADVLEELERAHPRYYADAGPVPPAGEGEVRVVPLREAKDFKLAKGAPDVRGWTVFGSDNERVGTVHEMLVDPVALKIVYLDVDLADDLFRLKEDRHVVIPLDRVELRERGQDVWVGTATAREIAQLPAYGGGTLDPLVEDRVRRAFGNGAALPPPVVVEDEPPPLPAEHDPRLPPPLP